MSDPLELAEVLKLIDRHELNIWESLDENQQKELKKTFYTLNRYISSIKTNDNELQAHLVRTVNEYYNKHWNALQSHPGLLWRLLCICSPVNNTLFHEWIGYKRTKKNPVVKFLEEMYPLMKSDELTLLAKITPVDELKTLAAHHGYTNKQIKAIFK